MASTRGIHAFWPAPRFGAGQIYFDAVQALTWAVSAVAWRRAHGPITLCTTTRGLKFAQTTKLADLYDGVSCALDRVDVDPQACWAAGKLFALADIPAPVVCLDLDTVVWQPLSLTADAGWGHDEPGDTPWYRGNRRRYGKWLPKAFDRAGLWRLPVANTCLLSLRDSRLQDFYLQTAIDWMRKFTAAKPRGRRAKLTAMVFAEQQLLPMCCALKQATTQAFGELTFAFGQPHLKWNPNFSHLWNSKAIYPAHWRSLRSYCDYLAAYLRRHGTAAAAQLAEKVAGQLDDYEARHAAQLAAQHRRVCARYPVLSFLEGELYIQEPNLPAPKRARLGDTLMPWEVLKAAKGCKFKLTVNGKLYCEADGARVKAYRSHFKIPLKPGLR